MDFSSMNNDRRTRSEYGLGTRAIHGGQAPDPSTGAIMTPIYQTSTYVQTSPGKHLGYEYSRSQNPTRQALETCIAGLEGAEYGIAFASGCAAADAVMHLLSPGARVLCSDDVYGGTYRLFSKVFARHGISFSFVDLSDPATVRPERFEGVDLVWLESPSNPLLKIIDINAISRLAHQGGATVVVDNTFLSPVFQQPLALGADVVVHSTTKYLNGHSDAIGGVLVTSDAALHERLRFIQNSVGAVPSPNDSFLVLRGLKTLHIRMQRHAENAQAIAEYLETHRVVDQVIYPGLSSHPHHELAKQQSSGSGGMISFIVKGDSAGHSSAALERARRILERLRVFALAESLGGVESLVEHPGIMTHASIEPDIRSRLGIVDGLIRLSVGIEDIEDQRSDLERALAPELSGLAMAAETISVP